MIKLLVQNRLGTALQRERKARGWTQVKLAQEAGLFRHTVRRLERGQGHLSSWSAVLEALWLELRGRNLPPGDTIGRQLALLRRRRKLGQRELAALVGVSPPTLVSLERDHHGRLEVLEQALERLGAGAYLARRESPRPFFAHAGNSSGSHGWETPGWLLEELYRLVGVFDLDPCSPTGNRRRAPVKARMLFTVEDDGLALPWHGRVFLNPPYGRRLSQWTRKAWAEVRDGKAKTVIALLPARTDTRWWHEDVAGKADVFFLRGRLSFGESGQTAPFPSALVVWGASEGTLMALRKGLSKAWIAPRDRRD